MQVLGFSPRVFEGARRFFKEHPVVSMSLLRDADMASACVPLTGAVCEKCGFVFKTSPLFVDELSKNLSAAGEEMPKGTLPRDFFNAIELTHAWDQASRSVYCGGHMKLVAGPARALSLAV